MPEDSPESGDATDAGPRDIVVPLRVYKTVTVFSTLGAIGLVVLGFVALDTATQRARAPASEIDPVLAGLGLAAIVAGGAVYALAARFRAPGMGGEARSDANRGTEAETGKAKAIDATDEGKGDG